MLTILFTLELLKTTRSYFNYETKTKVDLIAYEKDNNYPVITIVSSQEINDWPQEFSKYISETKNMNTHEHYGYQYSIGYLGIYPSY